MSRWLTASAVLVTLVASSSVTNAADTAKGEKAFTTGSSDVLIGYVNEQIRQGWTDNEIGPSGVATDEEWIRRVYLDVIGHVPPVEVVEKFLADKDPAKRTKLIDQLLDDPAYVRNWTAIWTNLMIGRITPRRVSRTGMQKFLRGAFSKNRPWNEVVFDVVSASGHFEKKGEVNYLLAQMTDNDDAVQATAKTTRLFMGIQVQCTQCHNHPFNDWKQDQFWSFNSFFRQARRQNYRKYDPRSGRMVDDYSELRFRDFSGPVYYEERSGVMRVAYPKYFTKKVDPGAEVDRRSELAKLMTAGDQPWIAKAMVNRMWGHFFGYGFTKPVDDMGPHNPASHPELLDRLAGEFVKSGYDVKQLIRWIANSEAYNLTSRYGKKNEIDNPSAGEVPLFSHLYVKQMQAEQLFDSLIVATEAHKSGRLNWDQAEQKRQQWMRQFVVAFNTDENDESTTFNGTIPQALMMMNGDLIQDAVSIEKGSFLRRVLEENGPDSKKIRRLYFSALSRAPTRKEIGAATKMIRARQADKIEAYQDLYWALLNSNEFIFIH
ncbi:MAG: DUF1553 domain-containing protein [Planctomycetaceae bacterium]|nr:DUF1553 domain-containing protein [Planctomycetaceae bacterium]MBT6485690.1 DUF1553 domain-containing protein [Planctomycetaceae bacterium]